MVLVESKIRLCRRSDKPMICCHAAALTSCWPYQVVADPVELVSEVVECTLGVSEKRLKEVFLIGDHLVALDGGANFLFENPDDFFG